MHQKAPVPIIFPGISLRHALLPRDAEELLQSLDSFHCPACGIGCPLTEEEEACCHQAGEIYYQKQLKTWACGFSAHVYAVLNDLLLQDGGQCLATQEAMSGKESLSLLNRCEKEEQLVSVQICAAKADWAAAEQRLASLLEEDPESGEYYLHQGWVCMKKGDHVAGEQAFAKMTELFPSFALGWQFRSVALSLLKRYDASRSCLERYQMLTMEAGEGEAETGEVLAAEQGMFEEVRVVQEGSLRRLMLGSQVQGGVLSPPFAEDFVPGQPHGPGALPEGMYNVGWLMIGTQNSEATGLMLGLGSGAGAVSLLHQFPEMQVTVVEIDPVVIKLARAWFPLVAYYEAQGRLHICNGDAYAFVAACREAFDFILVDIYQGQNLVAYPLLGHDFPQQLASISPNIWLNLIGHPKDGVLRKVADAFAKADVPLNTFFASLTKRHWFLMRGNWLATSQNVDLFQAGQYQPFADLSGDHVEMTQDHYRFVRTNHFQVRHWPE